MKTKGRKRVYQYTLGEIAERRGVSIQTVLKDRRNKVFDPEDLESVGEYLRKPKRKNG